jgi:hypothetical protein
MNFSRVIKILNSCINYLVCSSLMKMIRNLLSLNLFTFINNLVVANIVWKHLDWKGDRFHFSDYLRFSTLLFTFNILPEWPIFINLLLGYIETNFDFIYCKSFIFGKKKVVGHIVYLAILIKEASYFIMVFLWQKASLLKKLCKNNYLLIIKVKAKKKSNQELVYQKICTKF